MGKKDLFIYLSDVRFLFKAILQFSHFSAATIKELAQPFSQTWCTDLILKAGLSPFFICFNVSPSEMMKNVFYFILKALFVFKVFKFLSWSFGHVEKTAWLER